MSVTQQERALERACYLKLHALYEVGRHLGMWGVPAALRQKPCNPYPELVYACSILALHEGTPPLARAASCMMLDYLVPDWREGLTAEQLGLIVDRESAEVRAWRSRVLSRDGHRCTKCGAADRLHAHHVVAWSVAPHLRVVDGNGLTLCAGCHGDEHPKMAALIRSGCAS